MRFDSLILHEDAQNLTLILPHSLGLILALADNLSGGTSDNRLNVPSNVSSSVRTAQYFAIIVAVLSEFFVFFVGDYVLLCDWILYMISHSFFSVLWTDPLFYKSGGRDPYSSIFIENDSKKLSRRSAGLIIRNVFDKCHV